MCGLCGILGSEEHWSDTLGEQETATYKQRRRRELETRMRLAEVVLKPNGLKLKRWSSDGFLLATKTGKTLVVPHFAALAAHAEELRGKAIDPLDPDLLARLERS